MTDPIEAMARAGCAALRVETTPNEVKAFQREERYIVIKRKHLTERQEGEIRRLLAAEEIGTVECVVIENDWPENEIVWRMIEDRMAGGAK